MIRIIIFYIFFSVSLFALEDTSNSLTKQKIEVVELKKQLNTFYNEREMEYQQKKQELENILSQIEKEKNKIQKLRDENSEILNIIKQEVENKTSKIYNSMKPKNAADIFNQMIGEGKIDDVFDIIIKLKENNVTQIMKFLSVSNASLLTEKFKNFNAENMKKE